MSGTSRRLATGAVAVAAVLAVAGCSEVESESSEGYQPAKLQEVKNVKGLEVEGEDELYSVTFTAEGARRTGLRTAPVARAGGRLVMPYEALLYNAQGATFAYRTTAPRTFLRVPVQVDRIDGDRVVLTDGPAPGTAVVTVGAAEVRGAELDIAGSH
jgi:hypothetical protein